MVRTRKPFATAAREHGVPVNIVDMPDISTFSFGTIVNRSPVVIGISTAGVAPVLGQSIRGKIEALLHPALAAWAAAAKRSARADQCALRHGAGPPRCRGGSSPIGRWRLAPQPTENELFRGDRRASPRAGGSVALVGAGPGDPELLTLKALRALQSADIILYDRLVSPEILELARREARRMLVGKAGNGPRCRQDDINALMVKLARSGQRVVRLKGGDPMVFGRAAEEIEICRAAGIPVEVVPGITAALGAAAELQIPLTDRRTRAAPAVHHRPHARPAARRTATGRALPIRGRSRCSTWAPAPSRSMLPKLLEAGLSPATPALAVSSATTPRSTHVRCAVVRFAGRRWTSLDRSAPCLIMLGNGLADVEEEVSASRGLASVGWVSASARDPTRLALLGYGLRAKADLR